MKPLVNRAIEELGVKPGQYLLEMNPDLNVWVLKVNAEAVETEGGGFKEQVVKPASDTEAKAEILEKTIQEVAA